MTKLLNRWLDDPAKLELRKFFTGLIWITLGVLGFIYLLWTEMRSYNGY
ncbi:MAG: hypothetical protein WBR26_10505 [Candidatus Acidiferrum sp.]